ncbi:MAG: efflux RND transporter periplasmic adaptor subunit [Chloroflexota bacterium]|nr:efflux RND transporter periplasmic adaptor subunit [Chloroflexota bacterium]
MRVGQIAAVAALSLALAATTACNPFGGTQEQVKQEPIKVTRGDITITVTGSGNVAVSREVNLTFGTGGRIEKINVAEGDNVTAGSSLAKLETDTLELAITQANLAVAKAQLGVKQAEYNLNQARDLYTWPEIKIAQADVDDAKAYIDYVETNLANATSTAAEERWTAALAYARVRLTAAEAKLDAMIHTYDTDEVNLKKMELEVAKQTLDQTQQSLKNTRKQLDDAVIIAPFSGTVTSVPADPGDIVPVPTVAPKTIIHLVDLGSMELEVEVDERDVPLVKVGQKAIISVDALPDAKLAGKVAYISPLAVQEGGLVQYKVKTRFDVPPGSGLRVGMSATADIVVSEHDNVLLLPNRAVKRDSQGNSVVKIMVNGLVQDKKVVVGISNDFQTEIVSGLSDGDEVIIETRVTPSTGGGLFGQ